MPSIGAAGSRRRPGASVVTTWVPGPTGQLQGTLAAVRFTGVPFFSSKALWAEIERRLGQPGRGPIRAAVAYVTRDDLFKKGDELIVWLDENSAASRATNPAAILRLMNKRKVSCFHSKNLHAKVYLANDWALVGSANFSRHSAKLTEAAVLITDPRRLKQIRGWYEALRPQKELDTSTVRNLQAIYDAARRTPWRGTGREDKGRKASREVGAPGEPAFFYCNTNRRYSRLHRDGAFGDEKYMLRGRRASAFGSSRSQVDGVEEGSILFLYASGYGITAVGRAARAHRERREAGRREHYVPLEPFALLARPVTAMEINAAKLSKKYTFPSTCKPVKNSADALWMLKAACQRMADAGQRTYFQQYGRELQNKRADTS